MREPPRNATEASIAAGSADMDFKLVMSREELVDAVGLEVYHACVAAAGLGSTAPAAIAIRRTVGTGRWIDWHVDAAGRTVQVPLTDDAECTGGHLLFAGQDGRIRRAHRRVGVPIAHDGTAVHGVTRLDAGLRYGLYLLWDTFVPCVAAATESPHFSVQQQPPV